MTIRLLQGMTRAVRIGQGLAFLALMSMAGAAMAGDGLALVGIPVDFALFALVLLGVALFHDHTLKVALVGVVAIIAYKLAFTGFKGGDGLPGLAGHFVHEWVTLANLLCLLMGFALLARHFEKSHVPVILPRFLPDDWKGGFLLLTMVWFISSFLDNIAAAMIGGAMAHQLFRAKVHVGYLAGIVAASNSGGAWSVVGDTTTTMMWIAGISPLQVPPERREARTSVSNRCLYYLRLLLCVGVFRWPKVHGWSIACGEGCMECGDGVVEGNLKRLSDERLECRRRLVREVRERRVGRPAVAVPDVVAEKIGGDGVVDRVCACGRERVLKVVASARLAGRQEAVFRHVIRLLKCRPDTRVHAVPGDVGPLISRGSACRVIAGEDFLVGWPRVAPVPGVEQAPPVAFDLGKERVGCDRWLRRGRWARWRGERDCRGRREPWKERGRFDRGKGTWFHKSSPGLVCCEASVD